MDTVNKTLGVALMLLCTISSGSAAQQERSVSDFYALHQMPVSPGDPLARFPRTLNELENKKQAYVQFAREQFDAIASVPAKERTFANTVRPLDRMDSMLKAFFGEATQGMAITARLYHDAAMRDAALKALAAFDVLREELFDGNKVMYQALCEYDQCGSGKEHLEPAERYFIDERLAAFKRRGMHLPDGQRVQANALKGEIEQVVQTFVANIDRLAGFITATREQLAGVNEDMLNALTKNADGEYILRCDYPTRDEVMFHCTVSETRKRYHELFFNRAYPENMALLERLIALRDQFAKLLGFDSYAAYEISGEMAKTPERVECFLDQLVQQAAAKMSADVVQFKANLPEGVVLDEQERFNPWDYGYVYSRYRKKHFKIDHREIAQYFPVDKALQGMLNIYQKLFSVQFRSFKPTWAWDDEVRVLEVTSSKTGLLLGYIALDLYPREGKFSHAYCCPVAYPVQTVNGQEPAVAVIIANFPRTTDGKPALFKHRDVEVFFHEFGHAMHSMLAATKLRSQAGYQTTVDFLELPSQIFEEWLYDHDLLKGLSSHYLTGEQLPDDLVDALIKLKQFEAADMIISQTFMSYLSLFYFGSGEDKDTDAIRYKLNEQMRSHIKQTYTTHYQASFGHLGPYGSRYYGYLWSKVFALDVFYQLRPKGLTNPATGDWFVSEILGKGGSVDPNDMLRSFLGREPQIDAFFNDLGLH